MNIKMLPPVEDERQWRFEVQCLEPGFTNTRYVLEVPRHRIQEQAERGRPGEHYSAASKLSHAQAFFAEYARQEAEYAFDRMMKGLPYPA